MTKEVIKAMNKQNKEKSAMRKWWDKNKLKIARTVLFPIWCGVCVETKIKDYLYSKNKWNDKRANEILNYYIPRTAEWDSENKTFFFFDNGFGWSDGRKKIKWKDRYWWNLNKGFCGGKIRTFLINDFELEGFTKEVVDCSDGKTEISFKMNEK